MAKAKPKKKDELKFEDALNKLESIADELSLGDLDLNKALSKYEEGAKLLKQCHQALSRVEKKIQLVIKENKDIYRMEDFQKTPVKEDVGDKPSEEEGFLI